MDITGHINYFWLGRLSAKPAHHRPTVRPGLPARYLYQWSASLTLVGSWSVASMLLWHVKSAGHQSTQPSWRIEQFHLISVLPRLQSCSLRIKKGQSKSHLTESVSLSNIRWTTTAPLTSYTRSLLSCRLPTRVLSAFAPSAVKQLCPAVARLSVRRRGCPVIWTKYHHLSSFRKPQNVMKIAKLIPTC